MGLPAKRLIIGIRQSSVVIGIQDYHAKKDTKDLNFEEGFFLEALYM